MLRNVTHGSDFFLAKLCAISLIATVAILAGCSLQQENYQRVTVELPDYRAKFGSGPLTSGNVDLPPESLADINCIAINVMGEGIAPDHRVPNECPNTAKPYYPGVFGGTVPASGGVIDLLVPVGKNRVFQLLGFRSEEGCPFIYDLIEQDGHNLVGHPYEIGRVRADVLGDTKVEIQSYWDGTNQEVFCGGGGGGDDGPYFVLEGPRDFQTGSCVLLTGRAYTWDGVSTNLYYVSDPSTVRVIAPAEAQLFAYQSECETNMNASSQMDLHFEINQNISFESVFVKFNAPGTRNLQIGADLSVGHDPALTSDLRNETFNVTERPTQLQIEVLGGSSLVPNGSCIDFFVKTIDSSMNVVPWMDPNRLLDVNITGSTTGSGTLAFFPGHGCMGAGMGSGMASISNGSMEFAYSVQLNGGAVNDVIDLLANDVDMTMEGNASLTMY